MQQIATGIAKFASVLPIDLDQFHEIPLFPKMMIESDEENENEDEQDYMDEDEDELGEVDAQRRQPVDVILHANIGDVLSECLAPGVCFWRFPLDASQSRWKGRNGSNACSTISLLLGYFIQTKSIPIPMCHSYPTELPAELIGAVCGCIELGNDIYDMCRESLPSRYLSIEEAATAIHSWYPCNLNDPLPVRLVDSHETSTLHYQLTMATANAENSSACIIINERTSLYHMDNQRVMYIDTHNHDSFGAVVVVADVDNLQNFCHEVWNLEGHNKTTFGNLVFFRF